MLYWLGFITLYVVGYVVVLLILCAGCGHANGGGLGD